VIVATIRALKMHGGVALKDLGDENVEAVAKGFTNLEKHIENVRRFGLPPIVALNRFASDTDEEIAEVLNRCRGVGVSAALADVHGQGGGGALELGELVVAAARWHVWNPRSQPYTAIPADDKAAAARRAERWEPWPHTVGQARFVPMIDFPPEGKHTLDLRRYPAQAR
jgi:formate--tetrahydrofolate ligase